MRVIYQLTGATPVSFIAGSPKTGEFLCPYDRSSASSKADAHLALECQAGTWASGAHWRITRQTLILGGFESRTSALSNMDSKLKKNEVTEMAERPLTLKQQKFADEFIANGGNATQAAISAGYKKRAAHSTGAENLQKPAVANYIKKRRQALADSKVADQREILEYLTKVVRGKTKEETLIGVGKGEQDIVEIKVSEKDKLKAAEMLGRTMMMFTDNVNVATSDIHLVIGGDDDADNPGD